jgi:DNA-directed RNA polymerase sigma subunit (sigma70/sigma32)
VRRVVKQRLPLGVVARRFRLTKTRVCQIVREALGLIPSKAEAFRKRVDKWLAAQRRREPVGHTRPAPALTRAQRATRNRLIRWLVTEEGVALALVARRFGLSPTRVRQLAQRASRRSSSGRPT